MFHLQLYELPIPSHFISDADQFAKIKLSLFFTVSYSHKMYRQNANVMN